MPPAPLRAPQALSASPLGSGPPFRPPKANRLCNPILDAFLSWHKYALRLTARPSATNTLVPMWGLRRLAAIRADLNLRLKPPIPQLIYGHVPNVSFVPVVHKRYGRKNCARSLRIRMADPSAPAWMVWPVALREQKAKMYSPSVRPPLVLMPPYRYSLTLTLPSGSDSRPRSCAALPAASSVRLPAALPESLLTVRTRGFR